jgi:hypothetical protein
VSLSPSYLESLARLPKSRPLREFTPGAAGVFLRHDVDHDLDLALEMAYWEREAGHRATYFILPTAAYAADPALLSKLAQIRDFGHEIGVHLNFLASWVRGEIESVQDAARALVAQWRAAGLDIEGCAAHGDRACYEFGFINYWMFEELRPADPGTEAGLSPEGIPDPDPVRRIAYPASHRLGRGDGREFPLWSVSMAKLGLSYHATHLRMDHYYSDSGGEWRRTRSPLEADLSRGSHQVLMHPEYYRGPSKRIFVASTARSGSKWLAQLAAAATPCRSVHEFSLNHRYDDQGALVAEKRTGAGFASLQRRPWEVNELLLDTRRHVEALKQDYFECNVYLAHFLPELKLLFPEARIAHLHRDLREVVRSILNRDWYDTPEDARHPDFDDEEWAAAGQFARACLYAARTTRQIMPFADERIALETLAAKPDAAAAFFKSLGIAYYPRLAREAFAARVNANARSDFPAYADWRTEDKEVFARVCSDVMAALGYPTDAARAATPAAPPPRAATQPVSTDTRTVFELRNRWPPRPFGSRELRYSRAGGGLDIRLPPGRSGYLLLGGGRWSRILPIVHGWRGDKLAYYKVQCKGAIDSGQAVLHALFYDWTGKLIGTRAVSSLSPSVSDASAAFRINEARCRWLNLGLYFPKREQAGRTCRIDNLQLSKVSRRS